MNNCRYDYIIVGAGLAGSTIAYLLNKAGKKVKVLEKRSVIGGNCYTERKEGIDIHVYGPHIFHTSDEKVWNFVNQFAEFNNFINSPMAIAPDGNIYNMPFNMNTFSKIWPNIKTPQDAILKIHAEIDEYSKTHRNNNISNLEEQAISMVGTTIYELLVKGYTEKQWGRECTSLSPDIIKRLPLRFTYNNNYFNDKYQGVPVDGYTSMIENILKDIEIEFNVDFLDNKESYMKEANKIIYTGRIDEYYDRKFGRLEYRSLEFVTNRLDTSNYQGNAVVNYTGNHPDFTRIVEHKHFNPKPILEDWTYITFEFPSKTGDPCYPVLDKHNLDKYNKYKEYSEKDNKVIFAGRLGKYKYFDMDDVILDSMNLVDSILLNGGNANE